MPRSTTKAPKVVEDVEQVKLVHEVMEEERSHYPHIEVNGVAIPTDSLRITVARAKELLGWITMEEEYNRNKENRQWLKKHTDVDIWGSEYLLKDMGPHGNWKNQRKVRCYYNSRNRPFSMSWALRLAYDILNKHWKLNLETIIISEDGTILSGQHRLIGLVLAYQQWLGDESTAYANKWRKVWPEEPYIESLVSYGGSEDQRVVNTLDNVRSRSLSDVFYTSPEIFGNLPDDQRKKATRMLSSSVEFLWRRVVLSHYGEKAIPATHAVMVEFLDKHKKLLDHLGEIIKLDEKHALSRLGLKNVGQCAAMLYLMASSASDPNSYIGQEPLSEEVLNWDNEEKAKKFWKELAREDSAWFKPLRDGISHMTDPNTGKDSLLVDKICLLAKSWQLYLNEPPLPMSPRAILPNYFIDPVSNVKSLAEWPTFGEIPDKGGDPFGIDFGEPDKKTKEGGVSLVDILAGMGIADLGEDLESEKDDPIVSPEEVSAETERIRKEKDEKFKKQIQRKMSGK